MLGAVSQLLHSSTWPARAPLPVAAHGRSTQAMVDPTSLWPVATRMSPSGEEGDPAQLCQLWSAQAQGWSRCPSQSQSPSSPPCHQPSAMSQLTHQHSRPVTVAVTMAWPVHWHSTNSQCAIESGIDCNPLLRNFRRSNPCCGAGSVDHHTDGTTCRRAECSTEFESQEPLP